MKATKAKVGTAAPKATPAWWWVAGFAAAFFLLLEIYWPAVNGPFVFDDEYLPFFDPGFLEHGLSRLGLLQRPLLMVSYWLNLKQSGLEPFSYHLVNITLHFVNSCLVFFLMKKALEWVSLEPGERRLLAAFSALLFLVHPVHTESVAYIAGRSETLSVAFFLASYLVFLGRREQGLSWGASAAVILLFGAAFLSKEHAVVLPALILWTDLYFRTRDWREAIWRNWRLYAPLALMAAVGGLFVWRVLAAADSAGFRVMPWQHYFYTQWRAIWVYLRLYVLPIGLNADYDFPISRTPFDHMAIVGLMGLVLLLATAIAFRKHLPLALFGLVAFLLLLAPTSSVVPIKDAVAERRLYLPFFGLLLVTCDLLRSWKASKTAKLTVMGVWLALFAYLSYARSAVWGDPQKLWEDTVSKSPHNARAHFHLAMVHYTQERCAESLKHFANAEKAGYREHSLYVDWGLAHLCLNQFEEALAKLRQAAALENTGHVRSQIGMVLARQQKYAEALAELNEAAKLDSNYDMTFAYRGRIFLIQGELEKAEADFRRALALKPDNETARQGLAEIAGRKGLAR
ncbi:MAG: tetratricopeptide repeat protein [Bryobacteraceae bacterium]|nr:tetratricopeptide repeat protein [Bryobacteraceae bacterium]MDW8379177.1 tetratricopeptide repeat protein [Bryobacterales bacterium]